MLSTRPYLLRAFYEWIKDNGWTPHIVINAEWPGAEVPTQYVEDGQIILNIAQEAVHEMNMLNEAVDFKARFSGVTRHIKAPIKAVVAIYARENGRGIVFNEEMDGEDEGADVPPDSDNDPNPPPVSPPPQRPKGKPILKIVK